MLDYDVAVVGTGPAGIAAATRLAAAGIRTVILDKEAPPRYKTCGGGIVFRARRLMPVDLTPVAEATFRTAQVALLDSDLEISVTRDVPLVTMTMRAPLDALLLEHAVHHGAVLRARCAVVGLERERRDGNTVAVNLETSQGQLRVAHVIAADGARASLARLAGWSETRTLIPALEAEIPLAGNGLSGHALRETARFDFDIPPYGYGWVFPKRDHLSVGVLSVRQHRAGLPAVLGEYLARVGLGAPTTMEKHGFVIPVSPRTDGFARDRVYLTGDAAGFADPVTAEGISFSWRSGELAADALLSNGLTTGPDDSPEDTYERLIAQHLLPELSASRHLAKLLYRPRMRTWAFRRFGHRLTETLADVFVGDRTYASLLSGLTTWKRRLSR